MTNDDLLHLLHLLEEQKDPLNYLPTIEFDEAQIAFKNKSKLKFNAKLPYGVCEKAELFKVMKISGPWNNWNDHKIIKNSIRKEVNNVKYQTLSFVIRLTPFNIDNDVNKRNNWFNRWYGIYELYKKIEVNRIASFV